MQKFGSIPLKIKLPAIIVGVGLLCAAVAGSVGYFAISALAADNLHERITSVAKDGKDSIEGFYAEVSRDLSDMVSAPTTLAGFRRLSLGWKSNTLSAQETLTNDYLTNNPNPPGHRKDYDRAESVNTYNQQHAEFHPAFRHWTELHGYYDFFLIDLDGNVIYTVMKEADFASNLVTGNERNGPLAKVFAEAKSDPSGKIHFSDFEPYGPSAGVPASFAAAAIRDEKSGSVIGVMAIQISDALVAEAVNGNSNLGSSGEMLIAGPDGLTRSISRFPSGFKMLDKLPLLGRLSEGNLADYAQLEHATLSSGEIGSATQAKLDLPGLEWKVVVEVDDSEAYGPVKSAVENLTLGTLIAAVLAAGLGALFARGITMPIVSVSRSIARIAEGNLASEIEEANRNDEIGDIAKSLDALREKLNLASTLDQERHTKAAEQKIIVDALSVGLRDLSNGNLAQSIDTSFGEQDALRSDFNRTVDRLSETITLVLDTSESIRSRAREISHSSEELSNRTETQAATLEETAAALDELTASIRSAAEGAKEVENIVRSARNEAEESGKVVQGAVNAMTEIENSSDQISQIIGVIDDIAFQTNLLALNAGVEAARAGDAGRGFAVVASEVRALAQRSSGAAKEIKLLISASTQHVGRGVEQVGLAGEALANIVSRVGHISTLVSNIASAATEQSSGLAEINLGVSQLDQVTQQNAAMVEESTAASQSMSQEAAGLTELVSQFQVRKARISPATQAPRIASPTAQPRRSVRAAVEKRTMEKRAEEKARKPTLVMEAEVRDTAPRAQAAFAKGKWQDF